MEIRITIEVIPTNKVWKPIEWLENGFQIEDYDENGVPSYVEGGSRRVTEEERLMAVEFLKRENPWGVKQDVEPEPPMEVQPTKRTRNPFTMGRVH